MACELMMIISVKIDIMATKGTTHQEFLLIVLFKVFQTNRQFERFDRNVTISTSSFQSNRFINLLRKIKGSHHIDLVRSTSTFLLSTMRIYAH